MGKLKTRSAAAKRFSVQVRASLKEQKLIRAIFWKRNLRNVNVICVKPLSLLRAIRMRFARCAPSFNTLLHLRDWEELYNG